VTPVKLTVFYEKTKMLEELGDQYKVVFALLVLDTSRVGGGGVPPPPPPPPHIHTVTQAGVRNRMHWSPLSTIKNKNFFYLTDRFVDSQAAAHSPES